MFEKSWPLLLWIAAPLIGQTAGETAWDTHTRQGVALEKAGRYEDAAREFEAAVPEAGAGHLPITLDSLGVLYRNLGRYPDAERCHRRAIALLETAGPSHALELATALENLGALRLVENRPSQAQPLYLRAYNLSVQALGPQAPQAGKMLHGLAQSAHWRRRFDEAEDFYRRASAILEATAGKSSLIVADVWHNWGALYRETGRASQARPLLEGAAAIYQKAWPLHPKLAIILRNLAELEADAGYPGRAQDLFDRSLRICDAALPPDHPQTGVILQAYGRFLQNTHRKAEARLVNQRATAILARGMRANGAGDTVDVSEFKPR